MTRPPIVWPNVTREPARRVDRTAPAIREPEPGQLREGREELALEPREGGRSLVVARPDPVARRGRSRRSRPTGSGRRRSAGSSGTGCWCRSSPDGRPSRSPRAARAGAGRTPGRSRRRARTGPAGVDTSPSRPRSRRRRGRPRPSRRLSPSVDGVGPGDRAGQLDSGRTSGRAGGPRPNGSSRSADQADRPDPDAARDPFETDHPGALVDASRRARSRPVPGRDRAWPGRAGPRRPGRPGRRPARAASGPRPGPRRDRGRRAPRRGRSPRRPSRAAPATPVGLVGDGGGRRSPRDRSRSRGDELKAMSSCEVLPAEPLEQVDLVREVALAVGPSVDQARLAEAAVAAARPEPDEGRLDDDDPQGRVGLGQPDRRPQAGEPGPDDRHVGSRGAAQRRTRVRAPAVQPEADVIDGRSCHRLASVVGSRTTPSSVLVGIGTVRRRISQPHGTESTDIELTTHEAVCQDVGRRVPHRATVPPGVPPTGRTSHPTAPGRRARCRVRPSE